MSGHNVTWHGYHEQAQYRMAVAVRGIVRNVFAAAAREKAERRPLTCDACGCLCRPDEHCPGCKARRMREVAA